MGSAPSRNNKSNQNFSIKTNSLQYQNKQKIKKKAQQPNQRLIIEDEDKQIIGTIISTHCILSFLSQEDQLECIKYFTKWKYSKDNYIYRQHDPADKLFLICRGIVSVEIDCNSIRKLQDKQYFGHDSLFFQCPRGKSIRVHSNQTIIYQIKKQQVLPFLKKNMLNYTEDIKNAFSFIHFFNYLTNKQKELLIYNTFLFKLKKGQTIFEQDQQANSFYIIRKGSITISIHKKRAIHLQQNEYFGQSAFLKLIQNKKSQRMGKASANIEGTEVYGIGLVQVKKYLGNQFRSILFFNHLKWTLFRDQYLNSLPKVNYPMLLQLFNVKEGSKFEILSKKGEIPSLLFIPLQTQINFDRNLKLYCSQYLNENYNKSMSNDIILTETGYYAYALIDQFKKILDYGTNQSKINEIENKLLIQPLFKNLTLTLRNISKYSKMIPSSPYTTVLIVQDMKFGNQFILKIYNKNSKLQIEKERLEKQIFNKKNQQKKNQSFKIISTSKSLKKNLDFINSKLTIIQQYNQILNKRTIVLDENLIKRQKKLLQEISSKYICGYYKSQQDQNNYYLFLQYISGNKISEIISNFGIVPQNIIRYILASAASAISELHQKNIIYRNLNPKDIIVNHKGQVMLTDMSCAKKIENQQRTRTLIGIPHYMAPEMIEGKDYSYSVDIWSIGILLYQIITGKPPFASDLINPIQIYEQILLRQIDCSGFRNKKAKELVKCLLQKDPLKRIQKPLDIRKYSYINDEEFDWQLFLAEQMNPVYFPRQNSFKYLNIQNYHVFDASAVQEWQ